MYRPIPTHSYDPAVLTHTDASTLRVHSTASHNGYTTTWEFPGSFCAHAQTALELLARMIETGRIVESFEANNGLRVIYRFAN